MKLRSEGEKLVVSHSKLVGRGSLCLMLTASLGCLPLARAQESMPITGRATNRPAPNPNAFRVGQAAMERFRSGDFANAIKLCKQAIMMDPSNKEFFMLLALALSESGNQQEADMNFRAALSMDSSWVMCRNNYGVFLLTKLNKPDEAKRQFEAAIHLKPDYADPHYHLGEIKRKQGDLDAAIEEFQTAVNLKPKYPEAQQALGLALYDRSKTGAPGETNEAVDKLEKAAQLRPNDPLIHHHLAVLYAADGRLDQAEQEFRNALAIEPQMGITHYEFGRLRYLRGDLDRCLIEMKAALAINPAVTDQKKYPPTDITSLHEFIAKANEYKQRYPESIDEWKEVAALQKENDSTLRHIKDLEKLARAQAKQMPKMPYKLEDVQNLLDQGLYQTENGNTEQARSTFQRALDMNPHCFEAIQNIGFLFESGGDLNGAMAQFRKGAEILPKYDGVYYNMGYLLEKLGLPADAGLMYEKFHEIAGTYPYDPKHVVSIQQQDARRRERQLEFKKRGY